jgi:stress response protein YsnF
MSNTPPGNVPVRASVVERTAAARTPPRVRSGPSLSLEAHQESSPSGWTCVLPLRAEQITVEKRLVIRERIVVRTQAVEGTVRIEDAIQREQLQVSTDGQVQVVHADAAEPATPETPVTPPAGAPRWRGVRGSAEEGGRDS